MIRYALRCADGHDFESWFQSGDAFDALKRSGHLVCAVCGEARVEKALMAPKVTRKGATPTVPAEPDTKPDAPEKPLTKPAPAEAAGPMAKMERAIAELRKKVEASATYVGGSFAKEARAQHLGETPERPIWGEANPKEAKALMEDGVPVAPLPFRPKAKSN